MKRTHIWGIMLLMFSCIEGLAQPAGNSMKVSKVVNGTTVEVTYLTDDIVRVVKYVGEGAMPEKKTYSVVLKESTAKSPNVTATIDDATGCVTFSNRKGEVLLSEKQGTSTFEPRSEEVNKGKYRIGQTWTLVKDEDIYGLGQLRNTSMSWRGRNQGIYSRNTYNGIPYFTSSRGYGLYWDNAGKSNFKDSADGACFTSEVGAFIDYYFIYRDGTQDGVMAGVRQLSGQATMFPLWTLGFWQCRERYKTSDELAGVLDKYRELQIPLDGIVQDWQYWGCDSNWNAMKFQNPYYINKVDDPKWARFLPDDLKPLAEEYKAKGLQPRLKSPEEMISYVHNNNAHLMISIWPSFGMWTKQYQELKAIGALLPFEQWPRNKGVLCYDPFNPKARDIYWKHLTNLYKMGFDAWWTDNTEPDNFKESQATDDYATYDGSWLSVRNAYALMTNRGIYEHQRAMKGNNKRSFQMTRGGTFGIQHYGTLTWSGDIVASWDEMKNQIPSGLNYTLCGIPFWNTDIGGFFYYPFKQTGKNPAIQELQTRWTQWGTFMPLMRSHCSSPMISEIYEFGQKGDWAYDAMVDAIRLRYRLLPYIYAMAGNVVQHSGTMMRPLVMDFADDLKARRLNNQYMFGPALLVKPVTDPMYTWKDDNREGHLIFPDVKKATAATSVYLPAGTRWYDFFTGQVYDGGKTITRPTPINEMPVYVRAGSILPMGPEVQYSTEKPWDELELRIYPGADGTFTLYEDEGDNYNYERGQFTEIPFTWDDATRTLTIGQRRGQFKGMLQSRRFNIVVGAKGQQPAMQFNATIDYNGTETSVKL